MSFISDIQEVLRDISQLLRENGLEERARVFAVLFDEVISDPESAITKILALFSGSGSFNDLILHRDGRPLIEENRRLEVLKDKLYNFCVQFRTLRKR